MDIVSLDGIDNVVSAGCTGRDDSAISCPRCHLSNAVSLLGLVYRVCRWVDDLVSLVRAISESSEKVRFAFVVIIAAELAAIANLFKFEFAPSDLERLQYPQETLAWSTTRVNSAVWVNIFLFIILAFNLIRVRWYGEIEYVVGVLKMLFLVALILFNIIINIQTGTHFRLYQHPWGFLSRSFNTTTGKELTGGKAHLAGVWSAMTLTIFHMISMVAVSTTAAENRNFRTQEGIKIASRKIIIRVLTFYTLTTFLVGLNVPYDEPLLADKNISTTYSGTNSAFILAAVRAQKTFWPSFFNGFFIFSATSAGVNSLYQSSRILHAMALSSEAWPAWGVVERFRERLTETGSQGVPRNAVIASWLFGFLGYLTAGGTPQIVRVHLLRLESRPQLIVTKQQLWRMATNATASILIVFAAICITFIRFKHVSSCPRSRLPSSN